MKVLIVILALPILFGDRALANGHKARKRAAYAAARKAFTTRTFGVDGYLVKALAAQKHISFKRAKIWVGKHLLAGDRWGMMVGLHKARIQQTMGVDAATAQKMAEQRVGQHAFERLPHHFGGARFSEPMKIWAGKRLLKNDVYSVALVAKVVELRGKSYNDHRSNQEIIAEARQTVTEKAIKDVQANGPKVPSLVPRWTVSLQNAEIVKMAKHRGWSVTKTRHWVGKKILRGRTGFAMQTVIGEARPKGESRSRQLDALAYDFYDNAFPRLDRADQKALAKHWNVHSNQIPVILGEKLIKGDRRGALTDAQLARDLAKAQQ